VLVGTMGGASVRAGATAGPSAVPRSADADPARTVRTRGDSSRRGASATDAGNAVMSRAALTRAAGRPEAQIWRRAKGAGRRVALTFDDGDLGAWRRILRVLEAHRVRATFFILGRYVSAAPSLARRTLADGDAIGTHGWTHSIMAYESAGEIRGELQRSSAPWRTAAGGTPMPYLRPPYGIYDRKTLRVAAAQGFDRIVLWDVDPEDWRSPGTRVIVRRVLRAARPGSIVLLHVKPQTAAALPAIIRGLRARRLEPVTVPQLLSAAGYG
jgi:peptidoglycan-N-acetylglucosamine deacetylase